MRFSDAQPVPTKLEIVLKGEAIRHRSYLCGRYSLQSSVVKGHPYWKKSSTGIEAVWFDERNGNWKVGAGQNIGSDLCGIQGPCGVDEWPTNISSKWKFSNGTKFKEAGDDVIINGNGSFEIKKFRSVKRIHF